VDRTVGHCETRIRLSIVVAVDSKLRQAARSVSDTDVLASCVVLFSLAIAQPILELLGQNAEFFVARDSSVLDVVIVGVVIAIVVPVLIGITVTSVRRIHFVAGTVLHVAVIGTLTFVLLQKLIERASAVPLAVGILFATLGALSLAALIYKSQTSRFAIRIATLAPAAIVVSFLGLSSASALVWADTSGLGPTGITVGNPVPIVLVVLDEFPLASLIDADGEIQEDLYPNYARLASDSYWFRNAVTNENNTTRAIPAILTGQIGPNGALPVVSDYPDNLFTLLAGIYDIRAVEDVTMLCPEETCTPTEDAADWQQRWSTTLEDLTIVGMHVALPDTFGDYLPPLDQGWTGFARQAVVASSADSGEFDLDQRFREAARDRRDSSFQRFLDHLSTDSNKPTFDFLHILLPHGAWDYLPDGKLHGAPNPPIGRIDKGWGPDEWLIDQVYQRHLLQVQYTDTLIGTMIDLLQDRGTYDETLVIVLADHGVTFKAGLDHRRSLAEEAVGGLSAIPLFIKPPSNEEGAIDDYRAEIVDIVPTIADVLDLELPWATDGISLMSEHRPTREQTLMNVGKLSIDVAGEEKLEVAAQKLATFQNGDPFGLAPEGTEDLLGASLTNVAIEPEASFSAKLANEGNFDNVDPTTDLIPAYIHGTVDRSASDAPVRIAIAVNGTIQAIIPPDSFTPGRNEISLISIDGTDEAMTLSQIH